MHMRFLARLCPVESGPTGAPLGFHWGARIPGRVARALRMGEDIGHGGRGLVVVPFEGETDRNRLYIDRERVTEVKEHLGAVRVWFHGALSEPERAR
jgi:hypothetical protein